MVFNKGFTDKMMFEDTSGQGGGASHADYWGKAHCRQRELHVQRT